MSFLMPPKVKAPPATPTRADATAVAAGDRAYKPLQSFIGNMPTGGLQKKATTAKRSLIGGAGSTM